MTDGRFPQLTESSGRVTGTTPSPIGVPRGSAARDASVETAGASGSDSGVSARGAGNEASDSTSLAAASRAVSGARPNSRSIVAGREEWS